MGWKVKGEMLKQGCWPELDVPEPQRGRKRSSGKEEGGSIGHPSPPRPSHASQKFQLPRIVPHGRSAPSFSPFPFILCPAAALIAAGPLEGRARLSIPPSEVVDSASSPKR